MKYVYPSIEYTDLGGGQTHSPKREREFIVCGKFCTQGNTRKVSLELRCIIVAKVAISGLFHFCVHCPGRELVSEVVCFVLFFKHF